MAQRNPPKRQYAKLYVEPPETKYYLPVAGNISEDSYFKLVSYCERKHINRSAFIGEIIENWIDINIKDSKKRRRKG